MGVEFSRARDWLPFPVCLASGGQKAERLQGHWDAMSPPATISSQEGSMW